jgi:hypothetical protein
MPVSVVLIQRRLVFATYRVGIWWLVSSGAVMTKSSRGQRYLDSGRCPSARENQPTSTALLLPFVEEDELLEVDGLSAGSAAAGPAAQDGL